MEDVSNRHSLLSTLSTCKETFHSKSLSCPTNSSSHANNPRLQHHAAPSIPQPNVCILNTDSFFGIDNSNNLLNRSLKDTPPTQAFVQKKVFLPSPTKQLTLPPNHSSERIAETSLHQTDASQPPFLIQPPFIP